MVLRAARGPASACSGPRRSLGFRVVLQNNHLPDSVLDEFVLESAFDALFVGPLGC